MKNETLSKSEAQLIGEDGLEIHSRDSSGDKFTHAGSSLFCAREVLQEGDSIIERRAKASAHHLKLASATMDEAVAIFSAANVNLLKKAEAITESAKKTSGNVRNAGNQLFEGLQKIEKAANFDRLEKYVSLLERAATAMQLLAELEKTGKLEKIASAIR